MFAGGGVVARMLDGDMLRRLWNEHLAGARDHSSLIWAVMMLGLWERHAGSVAAPAAGVSA